MDRRWRATGMKTIIRRSLKALLATLVLVAAAVIVVVILQIATTWTPMIYILLGIFLAFVFVDNYRRMK
jgi:hypothetical protein